MIEKRKEETIASLYKVQDCKFSLSTMEFYYPGEEIEGFVFPNLFCNDKNKVHV
jgi:hypothetical protein